MKKFRMPTAYTVLAWLIFAVAVSTWFIPAGQYEYEGGVPVSGSYHTVESSPQGLFDVILAPLNGFFDAVDVELFILMVGGFLSVVMETGAINSGIASVVKKMHGREKWMIPILMTIFGIGGTTFGMWEETMAFYPLLIPVFVAAGYDAVVGISVILLGAGAGVLGSTVNPFATGIAAGFAGISLGEGLLLRLLIFIASEAAAILFVMRYAEKVRNDMPKQPFSHGGYGDLDPREESDAKPLNGRQKLVLTIFALTFAVMVYSVIPFDDMGITFLPSLGWWFPELGGLFLFSGTATGLIYGMGESKTAEKFVLGAADMLGVAFIIGMSRGITAVMNDGLITDTILHWGESLLSGTNSGMFILLVYLLFIPLSIFIPSSSGLATLSIPIMAPIGQFAGVESALIITAFQSASGLVNLITPTSGVVMGALAFGRISYDRWLRFIWKLLLIYFLISVLFLMLGVLL